MISNEEEFDRNKIMILKDFSNYSEVEKNRLDQIRICKIEAFEFLVFKLLAFTIVNEHFLVVDANWFSIPAFFYLCLFL